MKLQDRKFYEWAKRMWHKNCTERDMFGECIYTFNDYVQNNETFLLEKYREKLAKESSANWVETIRVGSKP
jgi:hypothetical protein